METNALNVLDAGTVQSTLKVVSTVWDQIQASPSHLLLAGVLLVLGVLIKASPVPNWIIPIILIVIGVGVYPWIAEPTLSAHQRFTHPRVILSVYGFCIGLGAVVAHILLKRFQKFRDIEDSIVNSFRRDEPK